MWREIRTHGAGSQEPGALFRGKPVGTLANEVDCPLHSHAIDNHGDPVAVLHLADRPASQCLRPMCPTQAPVETPENRASVRSATCFPKGSDFSAEVIW
jgi:hypothetical protein